MVVSETIFKVLMAEYHDIFASKLPAPTYSVGKRLGRGPPVPQESLASIALRTSAKLKLVCRGNWNNWCGFA